MRRPGRHAIARLRKRILMSAPELFTHNGFDKVTADEVAALARGPALPQQRGYVGEAVRTIIAILLDGCLGNHQQMTRDSHPAAGGLCG
jgi:hypothetical protein